jgi:hypothetical protein
MFFDTCARRLREEVCRSNTNPSRYLVNFYFLSPVVPTVSSIYLINGLTVSRADWNIVAEPHSLSSATDDEVLGWKRATVPRYNTISSDLRFCSNT